MICEWYALCDHEATAMVSHPVLGEVPTCQRCVDKHNMSGRIVARLTDRGREEVK